MWENEKLFLKQSMKKEGHFEKLKGRDGRGYFRSNGDNNEWGQREWNRERNRQWESHALETGDGKGQSYSNCKLFTYPVDIVEGCPHTSLARV